MFKIIPAVDLLDGKAVRLYQGDYAKSKIYFENPSDPVKNFIKSGADLIHVVDLNAARSGERDVNREALAEIIDAADGKAELELGGGIRNKSEIAECLKIGFSRCIIGTAAVMDRDFLKAALGEFGSEKIIVGVDAHNGSVRVSGWEKEGGIKTIDFLHDLEEIGVQEVIFTDIKTDGALTGPALDSIKEVLGATVEMHVIASGGIASLEDIKSLLELKNRRLIGAITGRALYEKKIDLAEAIRLCRN